MRRILGALGGLGLLFGGTALFRRARGIDLGGCVAVVTGGGRGLGLAVSRELLRRGCKLAICGRDGTVIARALEELGQGSADVFGMVCDASVPAQVDDFIAQVLGRFERIDLLINNAGQCFAGPAVELLPADVEAALRNIFWVHFHPTMAVLPHMRARRFGRIVNVTSIGGKVPLPHLAAYAVGKFAATGWSQILAVELAKDGVLVSTITPPPLDNGASLTTHFNGDREREFQWFARLLTSPWSAIDTRRCARVIVDAAQYGDRDRAVSARSWLMARLQGAAPRLMSRVLELVDRRMPAPGGPGVTSEMRLGREVLARSDDPEVQRLGMAAMRDARRFRPHPPDRRGAG